MDSPAKEFRRADDSVINTFICSMWRMLAGVGVWVKGENVTLEGNFVAVSLGLGVGEGFGGWQEWVTRSSFDRLRMSG